MGFGEAVRCCLQQKYATFAGRASRSEYWWFMLAYFIGAMIFMIPFFVMGGLDSVANGDLAGAPIVPIVLVSLYFLGMIIPTISVTVRRFHDRNLSGWWYLGLILAGAIPFVGIAATIGSFVITVLKGTPGANTFGRDPLGADTNADVFA